MTIHVWLNAAALAPIDVGKLDSPRWLRHVLLARCVVGWRGLLLG